MTSLDLILTGPLLIMGLGCLVLLMIGAFTDSAKATAIGTFAVLFVAAAHLVYHPGSGPVFPVAGGAGGHLMHVSPYTNMASLITLVMAMLCLPIIGAGFHGKHHKPELYVLLALSVTGMLAFITSAHLLTLYVALELMSFPIYILAAIMRDDAKSSEAGLKYFVLGSVASGLMLYGISLLYAGLGTLSFSGLFTAINTSVTSGVVTPVVLIGMCLVLVGSLFKLSVAPFHMWTPDVYEGAPTPVTAIMGALPKIAAFVLLVRLLDGPFAALENVWLPTLSVLAVISMLVGGTLAIVQNNLKRLLAFSTIANVGFVMVGVCAANAVGHSAVLLYMAIYGITTLGLFSIVMASGANTVEDLKGYSTRNPILAATFLLLLFSLAGIPPLAGFMAKFAVFSAAVKAGLTGLAVAGVLSSVVTLFYSLWLIKVMYFDAPNPATKLQPNPSQGLEIILLISAAATVLLGIFPSLLGNLTLAAATAVF